MPDNIYTQTKGPNAIQIVLLITLLLLGGLVAFNIASTNKLKGSSQAAAVALTHENPLFEEVILQAESAYVYDLYTGEVLYEKNAGVPMALASLTKIMLAIVASETLGKDTSVLISQRALGEEGDSGLIAGDLWRSEDLIDYTLAISSNDGAEALAEASAPYIKKIYPDAPSGSAASIWRMNEKAKELDLSQTYFLDSNGLDSSETMAGAYGTARDMTALMAYAITNHLDTFTNTSNSLQTFHSLSGAVYSADNTNNSLGNIPGIIAGKTGYTDLAGGNLVIAFDAGIGRPIIISVLGSTIEGRFKDVEKLARISKRHISQE